MQSEVPIVRQLDMFPDAAQEAHLCLDCGVDISHRRRDAQRCEPCSYFRTKERANNYYWENRPSVLERIKSRQQTLNISSHAKNGKRETQKSFWYTANGPRKSIEKRRVTTRKVEPARIVTLIYLRGGIGPKGACPAQHLLTGRVHGMPYRHFAQRGKSTILWRAMQATRPAV